MSSPTTVLGPLELKSAVIRDPLVVSPETTVVDAIAQMSLLRSCNLSARESRANGTDTAEAQLNDVYSDARSSCVLVVEDKQLLGILTERDVVRLSAQQQPLERLTMRQVMAHPAVTLCESSFTDLFFAINFLQQQRIRHLPILNALGCLVGLVTHESLQHISRPIDLLQLRLVKEVMSRDVICVPPDSSIFAVAQRMANHRVSSVVIVETTNEVEALRIPVGILTEGDLVQFQALGLNLQKCQAQAFMSQPIFSIKPEDSLSAVRQFMEERFIRRLVVIGQKGELLGIVTQKTLLQALNPTELHKLAESLENRVLRLEAEKVALLENRTVQLEQAVELHTATLKTKFVQERLLTELATQIRASLSIQTILDTTVKQIQRVLDCERVNIWQFEDSGQLTVVAEFAHSHLSLIGQQVNDTCFQQEFKELYRQGLTRVIPDIFLAELTDCHRELLIRLQTRAKILVPILCGEKLWGLLNVVESQHSRDWQPEEVELLQSLAIQIAIALQQATIHHQLQDELRERQQAEAQLKASEQRYASLAAAAPVGIFRTDTTGKCTYVNARWCQITEQTPEEAAGEGWKQGFHLEDRDRIAAALDLSILGKRPFFLEYRFQRSNGSIVWVYAQSEPEQDAEGNLIGYVGTITDISDRKQAEQQLYQFNQVLEAKIAERTAQLQTREAELQPLSERLTLSLKSGAIGSWEWDITENTLFWDERMYVLYSIPKPTDSFITYDHWIKALHPEDRTPAETLLQQAALGEAEYDTEFRVVHPDGSIHSIKAYGTVVQDAQHNPKCMIGVNFDITDLKRSEQTIREQAERERLLREITHKIRQSLDLQTIFDTACQEIRHLIQADRVGIFKFYPDSNFDDGEIVAESIVEGFSPVLGIPVHDHCFGENYAALYAKGRSYVVDDIYHGGMTVCHTDVLARFQVKANLVVPLLCKDELWGLLCIHQCASTRHWQQSEIDLTQQLASQLAIAIQQAKLVEKLHLELSERQQAEAKLTIINQQLAFSNEELARATRLKDEFLANMSHELRTPLNAILGMSEGLQEEIYGGLNDLQKKTITTIEHSGQHLLQLINDILDVSKISAGKLELDISTVSVAHLCKSSLAFVKELAHRKQIRLNTSLTSDTININVDERRMRQVLINLLNNAVKFTSIGGQITLEVHLTPIDINLAERIPLKRQPLPDIFSHDPVGACCPLQDFALSISVIDTGIGIDLIDQAKLFQPFIQIDSALNRKYEGTGLGLALVKQIVELHGGNVTLQSELGKGSCFTLYLPCIFSVSTQSCASSSKTPSDPLTLTSPTQTISPIILLAEDNEMNISTIFSYLTAKNYRILTAKDGEEALKLAVDHKPDLILMDIQMPGMDGLEATRRIRCDPNLAHIPIIALTALAMPGDRERCLDAGINDYLSKPVKLKGLADTIQRLLTVH